MRFFGKRSLSSFLKVCLDIAWYAGFAVLALGVGILIIYATSDPAELLSRMKVSTHDFLSLTSPGIKADWPMSVAKDTSFLPMAMAVGLLRGLFAQAVLYQLRKILSSLVEGRIFGESDGARVRTIGILVLAGIAVNGAAAFLLGMRMTRSVKLEGASLSAVFNVEPGELFLGLVLLVLGEILRCGAALKTEQDLTV